MGEGAPLPGWYDDLAGFEEACWRFVERGVADRRSPFHTPVLASIAMDGAPEARTVVLRGVEAATRTLRFHTDARAEKRTAIEREPRVSVQFYDKTQKLQLRMRGSASIATGNDAAAAQAWEATRPFSRETYRIDPAPGSPIPDGGAYAHSDNDDPAAGRDAFAVILVTVIETEALYLAAKGHRRARFADRSEWLVP